MNIFFINPVGITQQAPRELLILAQAARERGHAITFLDWNATGDSMEAVEDSLKTMAPLIRRIELVLAWCGNQTQMENWYKIYPFLKERATEALFCTAGSQRITNLVLDEIDFSGDVRTFIKILDNMPMRTFDSIVMGMNPAPEKPDEEIPHPDYSILKEEMMVYFGNSDLVIRKDALPPTTKKIDLKFDFKHSARYMVDEAVHLRKTFGVDFFGFIHDWTGRTDVLEDLCELWVNEGFHDNVKWGIQAGAWMTETLARNMTESGCIYWRIDYTDGNEQELVKIVDALSNVQSKPQIALKATEPQHFLPGIKFMKFKRLGGALLMDGPTTATDLPLLGLKTLVDSGQLDQAQKALTHS